LVDKLSQHAQRAINYPTIGKGNREIGTQAFTSSLSEVSAALDIKCKRQTVPIVYR
jgi:hypothetical protein